MNPHQLHGIRTWSPEKRQARLVQLHRQLQQADIGSHQHLTDEAIVILLEIFGHAVPGVSPLDLFKVSVIDRLPAEPGLPMTRIALRFLETWSLVRRYKRAVAANDREDQVRVRAVLAPRGLI